MEEKRLSNVWPAYAAYAWMWFVRNNAVEELRKKQVLRGPSPCRCRLCGVTVYQNRVPDWSSLKLSHLFFAGTAVLLFSTEIDKRL